MLVCTAAQMREIDRRTIEEIGIPGAVLMESAGRGVVDVVCRHLEVRGARVAVLCGGGNNGGDGFVVARHLIARGAKVRTYLVAPRERITGDALLNLSVLERLRGDVRPLQTTADLEREQSTLLHAHVVVDALLGTGLSSDVKGQYRRVLEWANRVSALKVAVDIPSGLNGDSGQVMSVAFKADHTVTFGYPKLGLVTHPGVEQTGELHVVDIGIPPAVEAGAEFAAEVLEADLIARRLDHRPVWGHKGTFGHLLVVAGSAGKSGAALLCAEAGLRSGVGLCTIASPPQVMKALESKTVETMLAPLLPDGAVIGDSDEVFTPLRSVLAGKSALALGPGVPRGPGMAAFLERLLRELEVPVVIDADGLNELAGDLGVLKGAQVPVLLTPHPGEMSRLTGLSVAAVQSSRVEVARAFAEQHRVYVALKGYRTVIAGPDGKVMINPTGNSGMASGGTGDVLTGLVGGLLAQHHDPLDALCIAVFAHGLAGDRAALRLGQRALLASDLLTEIGAVLKDWE